MGHGAGTDSLEPPPSLREDDAPSLLEEVAFGQGRAEALERERQRSREVIETMSSRVKAAPLSREGA
jgi:hypothetical protein